MDKKQRIATFASGSSHAMTLCAVDLDEKGMPKKWMVENSWGASSGYKGHLIMTDEWFDECMQTDAFCTLCITTLILILLMLEIIIQHFGAGLIRADFAV